MTDVINRIKTAPIKIPVALFLFPIISALYYILQRLCIIFSFQELLYSINEAYRYFEFFTGLSFLATGLYLGILFIKKKNAWYVAAAISFVTRSFLPGRLVGGAGLEMESLIVWLVGGITLAMPALQNTELKKIGEKTVILAVAYAILSGFFIHVDIYMPLAPGDWWYWPLSAVTHIVVCFELVYLMALILEYSKVFKSKQGLITSSSAGDSAVTTQVADLSSSAKEQASNISTKFTGSDADVPSTGADAGNTIADVVSGVGTSNLGSTPVRTTPSGGRQYKTVAGPVGLAISNKDSYSVGVNQYAAIIDREAVGGWQLDSIYKIPVTKSAGCLGSLFGKQDETVSFNMLIFYKDE